MEAREQAPYRRQSLWLLVVAFGFLMLHYLAVHHFGVRAGEESLPALVAHVPRELAIALFIAAVLNYFVDMNTQARHRQLELQVQQKLAENAESLNRDIRKNMLRAVFEQNLGTHVVRQIEQKLFAPTPYREEAEAHYSLTLARDGDGTPYVVVSIDFRYTSFNPGRLPATTGIGVETTSPSALARHLKIVRIRCDGQDVLDAERGRQSVCGGSLKYIDPSGCALAPEQRKDIQISSIRADYLEATETYVTTLPIEELRMTVHHPPELGIEVMSLHPDPVEVRTDTADTKSWRLRGLLPGQGISFWWRPVADANLDTHPTANSGINEIPAPPLQRA